MTRGEAERTCSWVVARRLAGVAVVVVGLIGLFGGFFAPWSVVLADPAVVPAPESWVAIWLMVVGAGLALWPARRKGPDRR